MQQDFVRQHCPEDSSQQHEVFAGSWFMGVSFKVGARYAGRGAWLQGRIVPSHRHHFIPTDFGRIMRYTSDRIGK
jgi:hypothetical protein